MAKKKGGFYGVRQGRTTGVFSTWDECAASVLGFSAASYKRFDSYEAAKAFALPGALGANGSALAQPRDGAPIADKAPAPQATSRQPATNGDVIVVEDDGDGSTSDDSGLRTNARSQQPAAGIDVSGYAAEAWAAETARQKAHTVHERGHERPPPPYISDECGDPFWCVREVTPEAEDAALGPVRVYQIETPFDPRSATYPESHKRYAPPTSSAEAEGSPSKRRARDVDVAADEDELEAMNAMDESSDTGDKRNVLDVYTDGCSLGNGQEASRAGYGVYFGGELDHLNEAGRLIGEPQTNNRAELMAVIRACELAPSGDDVQLRIHTDSRYVMYALTKWQHEWRRNGWQTTGRPRLPVLNRDLIELAERMLAARKHRPIIVHVAAHTGVLGNEEADRLAKEGAAKPQVAARQSGRLVNKQN